MRRTHAGILASVVIAVALGASPGWAAPEEFFLSVTVEQPSDASVEIGTPVFLQMLVAVGNPKIFKANSARLQQFITSIGEWKKVGLDDGALNQEAFTYSWTHPDGRMDKLHKAVAGLVQQAAQTQADAGVTFHLIRARGYAALGIPQPSGPPTLSFQSNLCRPARLTEDWFC